jgi:HSP20 family protein
MARNGFSPLRDFMSMRDAMDRMFEDRWVSPGNWLTWSSVGTNYLPLDIYETADDIVVRAVVPGVAPEGIDIQFQGGVLTLRAKSV